MNYPESNIKIYTEAELLARVEDKARGFTHFPSAKWLLGIRSKEDSFNLFDDMFFLFDEVKLIAQYNGTTNAGKNGLKAFNTYNDLGCAILQSDRIVYNCHERGFSKNREVFRQVKPFPYYRDNNKDNYADETGKLYYDVIYSHVHDVKNGNVDQYKEEINGWSLACLVMNNGMQYHNFLKVDTKGQDKLTVCLLKEW